MPSDKLCPVCCTPSAVAQGNGDYLEVRCPRCGGYSVTGTEAAMLEHQPLLGLQAMYASSWVREHPGIRLASHHDGLLRSVEPPPVDEQAARLLQHMAKHHRRPGEQFDVPITDPALNAIAWATDRLHFGFLVRDYLGQSRRFLTPERPTASNDTYRVTITPEGWAHLESLRKVNPHSELGFIAMRFHDSTVSLRDRGLKPAITEAGYRPVLMDEHLHGNRIDAEIMALIRRSRILVADLHGRRGGVYFEAGFAMGLGIPVFWTCSGRALDRQLIHFDVRQYVFTPWDGTDWPAFVKQLSSLIEAVAGAGPLKTSSLGT
jgi:hypothetical protein